MNRDELGRAIRAACANLAEPRVIVFGSQSSLGSYDDSELPPAAIAYEDTVAAAVNDSIVACGHIEASPPIPKTG